MTKKLKHTWKNPMANLTYLEEVFASVLVEHGISYTPHKTIHLSKSYIIADFYLPEYNVYCEHIGAHAPDSYRYDTIYEAFQKGYKLTYYHTQGDKHYFLSKTLDKMGLESNDALFTIPELCSYRYRLCSKCPKCSLETRLKFMLRDGKPIKEIQQHLACVKYLSYE